MSKYTKKDIIRLVEEEDVEFIRLQFTDMFGTMKNVAITSNQLEKALENGCMFDGSSIEGFVRIEESDMYLYPDLDTFAIFPWRPQQGKVARIICDVYRPDGKPFAGDPRYVLRRVVEEAKEMGYTLNVGPECEFFLFHTDDDGQPTTISHEKAGKMVAGHMISIGVEKYVFIGKKSDKKFIGFEKGLTDGNVNTREALTVFWEKDREKMLELMVEYLKEIPERAGIFTTNDMDALVVMNALMGAGIAIPQKAALVGFDNTFISKQVLPGITSVNQPIDEMCTFAVNNLLKQIQGEKQDKIQYTELTADLMIRESSAETFPT